MSRWTTRAGVGVIERLTEIGADLADLAVAEVAVAAQAVEGLALDQLGDQQGPAVLLPHLIEGDDAGVVEPGGGLRLAQDAPSPGAARIDRLDGDRALEAAVPGLVDRAEAAAAYAALDQEAVEDREPTNAPLDFGVRVASCGNPPPEFILSAHPTSLESPSLEESQHPGRPQAPAARRPERQQIVLRRALALGAGLLVLILIVIGVKGCLDARKHRALSDYSRNVSQIVEETEQTSKGFFGKLDEPGELSVTEFVARSTPTAARSTAT